MWINCPKSMDWPTETDVMPQTHPRASQKAWLLNNKLNGHSHCIKKSPGAPTTSGPRSLGNMQSRWGIHHCQTNVETPMVTMYVCGVSLWAGPLVLQPRMASSASPAVKDSVRLRLLAPSGYPS